MVVYPPFNAHTLGTPSSSSAQISVLHAFKSRTPGNAGLQLGTVQFPVGEVIRCAAGVSRFLVKSIPL